MVRRRSLFRQIQRDSYLVSRTAGDINALERGPEVYAKRRVRRYLTRSLFRMFR